MKLKRSALAHYLNAKPKEETPSWFRIGKDVEDMSVDLGADIETTKNILDETSVNHNGYEPSMEVDTYYANPEDSIYPLILDIAMNRLTGDDAKTQILEVIVEDTEASTHKAWQEDAVIEVGSYGGPTGGISIPYTVHFSGNREEGTVTLANKVPTFTAATATVLKTDASAGVAVKTASAKN